jgi:hypothetical protein
VLIGSTWRYRRCRRGLRASGSAIAPQWMFAPELKSGELIRLLEEWTLLPMDLWVIYPSGRLTSAKARSGVVRKDHRLGDMGHALVADFRSTAG